MDYLWFVFSNLSYLPGFKITADGEQLIIEADGFVYKGFVEPYYESLIKSVVFIKSKIEAREQLKLGNWVQVDKVETPRC